jgi:sugar lactone lactonase YvrE
MTQRKWVIWAVVGLVCLVRTGWAFEVSGLQTPESVIVDPKTGDYYISNIQGAPTERDNNGFITRLDKTGKVATLQFVAGGKGTELHAPKGLAIVGNVLYVTDIDRVRGFDKTTGAPLHDIDLKKLGALFLNDLAADDQGNLYVSDTATFIDPKAVGTIFKIETRVQHRASVYVRDRALGSPNGLMIQPKTKRLLANTWGTGKILEIGHDKRIKTLVEDATWKDLDGMDYDNAGNIYLSSFTGGTVYKVDSNLTVSVVKGGLTTPADIQLDRQANLILIPSLDGNTVTTITLQP